MSENSQVVRIIKKLMPAVVSIAISKDIEDLKKEIDTDIIPFLPKGKKFEIPEEMIDSHGRVKIGGGSGFIVDPSGIILTNKHVITDSKADYKVVTNDGKYHDAEILARDPINDIAILRIDDGKYPTVPLGDSSKAELGETVVAIGNALGIFKNTVSLGIVSGLSRSISAKESEKSPMMEMRGLIQTDAAINPGNSGGPLVNLKGLAIGINSATVLGAENIGFAIPVNAAIRDLKDLKQYGHIRRPLLGIRYLTLNEKLKEKLQIPYDYGAMVIREGYGSHGVVPNSPADRAGIKGGDIVLKCNGEKITKEKTIQDFLEGMKVGQKVTFTTYRSGKESEVEITLAERK